MKARLELLKDVSHQRQMLALCHKSRQQLAHLIMRKKTIVENLYHHFIEKCFGCDSHSFHILNLMEE